MVLTFQLQKDKIFLYFYSIKCFTFDLLFHFQVFYSPRSILFMEGGVTQPIPPAACSRFHLLNLIFLYWSERPHLYHMYCFLNISAFTVFLWCFVSEQDHSILLTIVLTPLSLLTSSDGSQFLTTYYLSQSCWDAFSPSCLVVSCWSLSTSISFTAEHPAARYYGVPTCPFWAMLCLYPWMLFFCCFREIL